MRKYCYMAVFLSICLLFSGCGGEEGNSKDNQKAVQQGREVQRGNPAKEGTAAPEKETGTTGDTGGKQTGTEDAKKPEAGLRVLSDRQMSFVSGNGYYYIEGMQKDLGKDLWGSHIMYMDFATRKEVYLCNEPGCKHRDENCTSVLTEEFSSDCLIFAVNDRLYLVNRDDQYGEDTTVVNQGDGLEDTVSKRMPTTIYSMGLDGTNRKKEYTFEQDITVEHTVLWDGEAMYFIAKRLKTEKKKGTSYTTASDRELVKYYPEKGELKKVCSIGGKSNVSWQIAGCSNGKVILYGTKYNQNLTLEEQNKLDNEDYWKYSRDSRDVYAWLNLSDGSVKELYSTKNDEQYYTSTALLGDYLYVSRQETKRIDKIDIWTGKAQKLATIKDGSISDTLSDKLCCQDWNGRGDKTWYFVDVNSGKVEHSTLVNQCNGWSLEIIGEWKDQVLAIYDYDADDEGDDTWEIHRKQFGLIDKKDLYQSKNRFKKIAMKGAGE